MVGLGGLNKSKMDRTKCFICGHVFGENESKTLYPGEHEKGFRCSKCDDGKIHKRPLSLK